MAISSFAATVVPASAARHVTRPTAESATSLNMTRRNPLQQPTPREPLYMSPGNASSSGTLPRTGASGQNAPAQLPGTRRPTLPWIREAAFGAALGGRAKAIAKSGDRPSYLGPPDLVHWSRPHATKASSILWDPFETRPETQQKNEDGYVGFLHYINGIDYSLGARAVERHLASAIGLETLENGHFWSAKTDTSKFGTGAEKQMVVTLCAYNAFSKAEFRARMVVSRARAAGKAVPVDFSYTIHSQVSKKLHSYSRDTVGQVAGRFWAELAASTLARLCLSTDDPAHQVCGTVNLAEMVGSPQKTRASAALLVSVLRKGHLCGTRRRFGSVTTCGADFVKTDKFRNFLVDALVRVVALDISGETGERAIAQIGKIYGSEFDVVVCRLLRASPGKNNDSRFLRLVHGSLTRSVSEGKSCQDALLLIEQARFLIGRKMYDLAVKVAAAAVALLPLDFDAWYTLALSYTMGGDYRRALETINALPVHFAKHDLGASVDGIEDAYGTAFVANSKDGRSAVDARAFEAMFPPPTVDLADYNTPKYSKESKKAAKSPKPAKSVVELASVETIWHAQYLAQPQLRHPVSGPFYPTPLLSASSLELSAVDPRLLKLAGPGATKLALAAQSAENPWSSLCDFDHKSTWGRAYDLVTVLVTLVGWDALVHIKNETFQTQKRQAPTPQEDLGGSVKESDFVVDRKTLARPQVRPWLQSLFLVVYEDLKAMTQLAGQNQDRSALAWSMVGFVGWGCKFNLKDNLAAIWTSVAGSSPHAGFDYHGVVKVLEIHNEFVLSDVCASTIDPLSSIYDGRQYSNKLIVQDSSMETYRTFVQRLEGGHFSLENVLLCLTKLVAYNVRWYNYMPSSLVTETLVKLCTKHDPDVVRSALQILWQKRSRKRTKPAATYTLRGMFAAPETDASPYEFTETDTVMEYMDALVRWIEGVNVDSGDS